MKRFEEERAAKAKPQLDCVSVKKTPYDIRKSGTFRAPRKVQPVAKESKEECSPPPKRKAAEAKPRPSDHMCQEMVLLRQPVKLMKYYDTAFASADVNIANPYTWEGTELDPTTTVEGTPVSDPLGLCQPKEGTDINQRIGREIEVHRIKIRINRSTIDRILIVQDTQTNGAQLNGEDVMTAFPSATYNDSAIAGFPNVSNLHRFKILVDQDSVVFKQLAQNVIFTFIIYDFKTPVRVRFNGTNSGTITDVIDNSFHVIGNDISSGSADPLYYACRVCYKD